MTACRYNYRSVVKKNALETDVDLMRRSTKIQAGRFHDICDQFGLEWDIKFNPSKSQTITFSGVNHTVIRLC